MLAAALSTACSNYHYKDYQGEWVPETMTPYDLSDNAADAPVVYFATTQFRSIGVPFHRLLLATQVDNTPLPGAGRRSILDISGMQALRLTPGKHTLDWCWVSMNALGTGGAKCGFGARDVEFRAGQRYVVDFSTSDDIIGPPGREMLSITIKSEIRNLDTREVIYPTKDVAQLKK
ncbi:putative lipoprotein [Pseudomonas syringae pv. actinidiae]|uniref:Putative lipoprotein n=2 Tax=Pseudomonas syringae TaxID=317 RepID=A0A7Z6UB46_PSESF|nr:putative lipoprotein [Pseudomonas syringae pv. actinidiae]